MAQCESCHGDEGAGPYSILGVCNHTDCDDTAALASYIDTNMPLTPSPQTCVGECAQSVAQYIVTSLRVGNSSSAHSELTFQCDAQATPEADVWRRLSYLQYRNTVHALLTEFIGSGEANVIFNQLWEEFEALPQETRPQIDEDLRGTYRRLEQSVYDSHVEAWYTLANGLAERLTAADRIAYVVGDCANQPGNATECVSTFVNQFGRIALRRPLTNDEQTLYQEFYGDLGSPSSEGYANIISGMLNSPYFLYLIEHGDSDGNDAQALLSAHELASRLSFHFWNSMPDAELRALADSGQLLEEATYQAQVSRLFNDGRTQETIREFYREWLKLENLGSLASENYLSEYQTFAGDNLPSWGLHVDMQNEALDFMDYGTWQGGFSLSEFFTSQLLFPVTDELAAIYGVASQAPGVGVLAPNNTRPGLLTRAAILATRGMNTRPIMKGVFIRENLLCDEIPPPPDNATSDLPELSPLLSTREEVEAITEREDTSCAFCHLNLINGLGYPTENFDSLGRLRNQEMIINSDGEVIGHAEVNTQAVPVVTRGDNTTVADASELMELIINSGKLEQCVARHYFRFSFARWEHESYDGCTLETLRSNIAEGQSITEMLRSVALTEQFRRKSFGQ